MTARDQQWNMFVVCSHQTCCVECCCKSKLKHKFHFPAGSSGMTAINIFTSLPLQSTILASNTGIFCFGVKQSYVWSVQWESSKCFVIKAKWVPLVPLPLVVLSVVVVVNLVVVVVVLFVVVLLVVVAEKQQQFNFC